ncbi:polysaccharide deacetylase family protein [Demequina salsinemoris]|uniref:polysaccharide deacetylase family protein n=1 Tax=Demequina salsinemoris TaxID=577470 RepID=UPI00078475AD|nr:polysaccharide deacetylase family protein [Demequina salsinemoris]
MAVERVSKVAAATLAGALLTGCLVLGGDEVAAAPAQAAAVSVRAIEASTGVESVIVDLSGATLRDAVRLASAQKPRIPAIQDFTGTLVGYAPSMPTAETMDDADAELVSNVVSGTAESEDANSEGAKSEGAKSEAATTTDTDCSVEKCLALTFDDGPVDGTAELLDVLAERGAKATFFVVGKNASQHPDIVKRMVAEGHAVGNHSWSHADLTDLSDKQLAREITRTSDRIEQITGVRPTVLRPPYGATGPRVAAVAEDEGLAQILWDVDPADWKVRDAGKVTKRVVKDAHPGAIVLSHDIHESTRDAYAKIIDKLLAQGYTLVTIPDLLDDMEPGETYLSR